MRDGVDMVTDPVSVAVDAALDDSVWLRLTVSDDARVPGRTIDLGEPALATIQQRLDALFGGRAMLHVHADAYGFRTTIRLPLDALRRELV